MWVEYSSDGTIIGGPGPGESNLISGNVIANLRIEGDNTAVRSDFIGPDVTGTNALSTGAIGIQVADGFGSGANNTSIGAPFFPNVISGNATGILVSADMFPATNSVTGTTIQGNLIGTGTTGATDVGNAVHGIYVDNLSSTDLQTTVGGTAAGAKNVIAFNGADGVSVAGGTGTQIEQNSIFENGGLGIDLGNDGPTANDAPNSGDPDAGPNGLQNYPEITRADTWEGNTYIRANFDSALSTTFVIDLYSNPIGDPEGKTFIGSTQPTTFASGYAFIDVVVPADTSGLAITATATDPTGNTSEFSAPFETTTYFPPPNDNKADAKKIDGNSVVIGATTKAATTEAGENLAFTEDNTVWFKWKAPRTRSYSVDTCFNPTINSILIVYKRRSSGGLKQIGTTGGCGPIVFSAKKDSKYFFQVGDGPPDRDGDFTLTLDKV